MRTVALRAVSMRFLRVGAVQRPGAGALSTRRSGSATDAGDGRFSALRDYRHELAVGRVRRALARRSGRPYGSRPSAASPALLIRAQLPPGSLMERPASCGRCAQPDTLVVISTLS